MDNSDNSERGIVKAADIMSEVVEVVKKDTSISQVAHLMLRNRYSGYPIVNDSGEVIGIVTLTDLFVLIDKMISGINLDDRSVSLHNIILSFKDEPVEKIMSKNVISILPHTTLDEIISIIAKWNIHTFPVIKEGKLVGIVGRRDVLNASFGIDKS